MSRLTLTTAGESHGPLLTGVVTGLPAGLRIDPALVDRDLARRQHGYGRGGRMKIEKDAVRFTGGLRGGETIGGPVSFEIANLDHDGGKDVMGPISVDPEAARKRRLTSPRPGHADLAGGLKYGRRDLRDILERASARESAARVAAGALFKAVLASFGAELRSGVLSIGDVSVPRAGERGFQDLLGVDDSSPLRAVDRTVEDAMKAAVDAAAKAGDTLRGTSLVGARGVPSGPAGAVIGEAMLAFVLCDALLAKTGGDSMGEVRRNFDAFVAAQRAF